MVGPQTVKKGMVIYAKYGYTSKVRLKCALQSCSKEPRIWAKKKKTISLLDSLLPPLYNKTPIKGICTKMDRMWIISKSVKLK